MASYLQSSPLFASSILTRKVDDLSLVRVKILPVPTYIEASGSDNSAMVLCSLEVMRQLRCMDKSWVTLKSKRAERAVKVRISEREDVVESQSICICSSLAFNLQIEDLTEPSVYVIPGGSWSSLSPVKQTIRDDKPPVAVSLTIARVKSPESSGHADYSRDIRKHFESCQRIVRIGDVFLVKVEEEITFIAKKDVEGKENEATTSSGSVHSSAIDLTDLGLFSKEPIPHPMKFVYFKVTNVQIDSESPHDYREEVRVDPSGVTTLKQVGAIHSRIPDTSNPHDIVDPRLVRLLRPALLADSLSSPQTARPDVALLLCGPRGSGKRSSVRTLAKRCNIHVKQVSLTSARGLPQDRVIPLLEEAFLDAGQVSPCVLVLNNLESLTPVGSAGKEKPDDPDQVALALRRLVRSRKQCIVGIALRLDDVHPVIRSCFTHELEFSPPDRTKRLEVLSSLTSSAAVDMHVDLNDLVSKTAGRTALDLRAVLADAGHRAGMEGSETIKMGDLLEAVDELPGAMEELSTAAPKIPEVRWDDVGGLMHAKDEILDMVQLPLKRPDLFASGMRTRSGILLFGPPGTGKTLLAKAVATECAMNFISVKGPELLDMYIGESERKVREVFETARAAKPCVLFFDELDSLAPQRGRGSDSGGVMDRVVSQLLTEIDGMQKGSGDVFVIGATNRPDLLDSSLLRPGRFDRLIYLGICQDRNEQLKIVKALTRKYIHEADVDLSRLLENAPMNLTGADFYALCSDAMANALKRRVSELSERARREGVTPRHLLRSLSEDELQVRVGMDDYLRAISGLVPSVSDQEILHYERLREKFANKDVKRLTESTNGFHPQANEEEMNQHGKVALDRSLNLD